jgi:hypothetical protein
MPFLTVLQPFASLGLSPVKVATKFDRFKLPELSKDKEFYLALRRYLAGLAAG